VRLGRIAYGCGLVRLETLFVVEVSRLRGCCDVTAYFLGDYGACVREGVI